MPFIRTVKGWSGILDWNYSKTYFSCTSFNLRASGCTVDSKGQMKPIDTELWLTKFKAQKLRGHELILTSNASRRPVSRHKQIAPCSWTTIIAAPFVRDRWGWSVEPCEVFAGIDPTLIRFEFSNISPISRYIDTFVLITRTWWNWNLMGESKTDHYNLALR